MSGDQQNFPRKNQGLAFADQMGRGYSPGRHISSFLGQNVDFQPTQDCPRNFMIFDRTDNCSQIMYNPATTSNFLSMVQKDAYGSSAMNEDLEDIDALLSFEDEYEDEEDDEDVSTARIEGNDASSTSDTCSSRPRNGGMGLSSSHESSNGEQKHEKIRKMLKSLRGIVPGGNQRMNTADVLDESVKYLKSLQVEAQKMGVDDLWR